jgi:hypothetical protein
MTALATSLGGALRRGYGPAARGALAAGCLASSLVVGWAVSGPRGPVVVGILLGVIVFLLLLAWNRGVAIGCLVLAVLNGVPGVDVDSFTRKGSFRLSDFLIGVLIVAVTFANIAEARAGWRGDRWLRAASFWGVVFVAWWSFTVLRTWLDEDASLLQAVLYGRDFLYFGLLLPLLVGALRRREHVVGLLGALGAGTVVYALAQIQLVAGVTLLPMDPDWFVHEFRADRLGSIPRIYALMSDAVTAAVPLGIGLALLGQTRRARALGATVALVVGASMLLQLTRATYLGLLVGLAVAALVWSRASARSGRVVRKTLSFLTAALVMVLGFAVLAGYRPSLSSDSTAGIVSERVVSGFQELSAGSGTVDYRYDLVGRMVELLDGRWLHGLGFLHPDAHPIAGLPSGAIRNADVGVMNSLMTMGGVGTLLLYLPLFALGVALVRAAVQRSGQGDAWLLFGGLVWVVATVVGSLTLITLFSVAGLVLSAALLACFCRALPSAEDEERTT